MKFEIVLYDSKLCIKVYDILNEPPMIRSLLKTLEDIIYNIPIKIVDLKTLLYDVKDFIIPFQPGFVIVPENWIVHTRYNKIKATLPLSDYIQRHGNQWP